MSKSAILSSSIAKKWWMALTGLFLCTFLIGHLLGNLQLIFITGVEGKRAFNEYAYFMVHNPFIKILSYLTYFSILFHAVDGFLLTFQNKKARPVKYAYNKPGTNSKPASRYMALLGSVILIFIVTHMANFWWKMKFSGDPMPLHTENFFQPEMAGQGKVEDTAKKVYYTTNSSYVPVDEVEVKNGTDLYSSNKSVMEQIAQIDPSYTPKGDNPKVAEGYKDLHSVVFAFFGHDKTDEAGIPANEYALVAVIGYVLAMLVLIFHLMHGFAAAFQSLGINHKRYNPLIKGFGMVFAVLIPLAFAIIPVLIYMWR